MEKSYAQHYALLEGEHWWFRARRMILRDLLAQLEWPPQPKILEIGVGPGYNLLEIYPSGARLEGVEPDCGAGQPWQRHGVRRQFSTRRLINFLRRSRKDPMTASQCLTCSSTFQMTHVHSKS